MITTNRIVRYEARGAMDSQDAGDLAGHMLTIATALASNGGRLNVDSQDMELRVARIVRIVQRATQEDLPSTTHCPGITGMAMIDDNGRRTIVIGTGRADVVIDLDPRNRRTIRLVDASRR